MVAESHVRQSKLVLNNRLIDVFPKNLSSLLKPTCRSRQDNEWVDSTIYQQQYVANDIKFLNAPAYEPVKGGGRRSCMTAGGGCWLAMLAALLLDALLFFLAGGGSGGVVIMGGLKSPITILQRTNEF